MKKHTLFIISIITVALSIGIWRDNQDHPGKVKQFTAQPLRSGTKINQTQKIPPFHLIDMHNRPFEKEALLKRWSFLFFGYTQCPHICPATLGILHQISQRLRGLPDVQFIFVSIDPEQDTPEHLKTFLHSKFSGTPFIGVSGERENITRFAQAFGAHLQPNLQNTVEHLEHSGTIFLISPEGKLNALFTTHDNVQTIIQDFKEIVHDYLNQSTSA